jgi:uncharacterized protein YjiS (DUF1127 family)
MFHHDPLSFVRRAVNRWRADRMERAVFRELLNLGPRMLDDIGLSINDVTAALEMNRRKLRHADRLSAIEALRRSEDAPALFSHT